MGKGKSSRRRVLQSALGGLLLAPILRQRRLEAQNANPKRIIVVFTPDSHPPEWWPTGSGTSFTLQEPLADFVGMEGEILFVRRIDHHWTTDNHHEAGVCQLFTGERFNDDNSRYAAGPSLDQYILQNTEIRDGTPLASVHAGVDDGRTDMRHIISYSGPGQPIVAQVDPGRLFDGTFAGVSFGGTAPQPKPAAEPVDDPLADATFASDQRIVEVNAEEIADIQRYLGQLEKQKMDLHLQGLQELQQQIQAARANAESEGGGPSLPVGGTCESVSTQGFSGSLNNESSMTTWARMQADILVNAFTCDRTRVGGFQFSFSGGHHNGLLGYSESWHDNVAHISRTNDNISVGGQGMTTRDAFQLFDRFWSGHIAYLAQRLASIQEGDGTMLDNTLIYWGVESGTNHNHSPADMQYLLIGGRNLGFQLGQFLNVDRQSANKLHAAVLQGFGIAANGFGDEPSAGVLAGVVA